MNQNQVFKSQTILVLFWIQNSGSGPRFFHIVAQILEFQTNTSFPKFWFWVRSGFQLSHA